MRSLIVYVLSLTPMLVFAQVVNDKIANRVELQLDSGFVYSNTFKSTVEWSCINKALTNSCLVYHNDQWFYFTPDSSERQYVNITRQQCKNFKGVQVVVMEGNPCETYTYRLIHCTSFTDQNDTFIELNSLKAGVQYLVLIDGFLGDQCDFAIQWSTKPTGFPEQRTSLDTLSLTSYQAGECVTLKWQANQRLMEDLDHFEVFRQSATDSKAERLGTIAKTTNAFGMHSETYEYKDCVSKADRDIYSIVGVFNNNEHRMLLDEKQILISPPRQEYVIEKRIIQFPINFLFVGEVEIVVTDAEKGTSLFGFTIPDGRNQSVPVDVNRHVANGKRFFRIKATHVKSRNNFTQTYAWSDDGEWVVVPKFRK